MLKNKMPLFMADGAGGSGAGTGGNGDGQNNPGNNNNEPNGNGNNNSGQNNNEGGKTPEIDYEKLCVKCLFTTFTRKIKSP